MDLSPGPFPCPASDRAGSADSNVGRLRCATALGSASPLNRDPTWKLTNDQIIRSPLSGSTLHGQPHSHMWRGVPIMFTAVLSVLPQLLTSAHLYCPNALTSKAPLVRTWAPPVCTNFPMWALTSLLELPCLSFPASALSHPTQVLIPYTPTSSRRYSVYQLPHLCYL